MILMLLFPSLKIEISIINSVRYPSGAIQEAWHFQLSRASDRIISTFWWRSFRPYAMSRRMTLGGLAGDELGNMRKPLLAPCKLGTPRPAWGPRSWERRSVQLWYPSRKSDIDISFNQMHKVSSLGRILKIVLKVAVIFIISCAVV